MDTEKKHWRRYALAKGIVFLGVITVFFYYMIVGTMPKYKTTATAEEIRIADLSEDYICLGADLFEAYKGSLYDSKDFAEEKISSKAPDAKYETCRLVLPLKKEITYGITGQTATYAQRVYVNGELLSEMGMVSDRAENFVPQTDLYTVYFTPQTDQTEIIVQHAWFNHQTGALHKLYLAEQQVIVRTDRAQNLCDGLIIGTLLAMAIFFFGMFLFYSTHKGMLWFSLSCLCAAANYMLYESKQIMVFFRNLNWYAGHRTEHLTNIYYLFFIAMFAFAMLEIHPEKWFKRLSLIFLSAITIYYLLVPSTFYTRYMVYISGAMMLYNLFVTGRLLWRAVREKKVSRPDHLIACGSVLLTALVYIVEGITCFSHIFYLRSYAMILLAFGNALALTIHFSETQQRLNEAEQKEREIVEENVMLEKMNALKNDFMRNIAHEMKTPLTVMSGYAQLTKRQMQKNVVNAETAVNLETIAKEATRLSDMVTKLLDVTYNGKVSHGFTRFLPKDLLEDAAAVCRPILAKNGNVLRIICKSTRSIYSNQEALLQVLINLAVNSGKHTKNGIILFEAKEQDARIDFYVSDSGSGISEQDLPHIFERGYSTDGGNGLGLTICREILESVGGVIAVEKTGQEGTVLRFTIPLEGKEEQL